MVRRQAAEAIEGQKQQMIAAIFSNPNWDDKENNRAGRLKELEDNYNRAIEAVYDPNLAKEDEQEIDWSNPFWQAEKRAQEKLQAVLDSQKLEGRHRTYVEMDDEQKEARLKARKSIDQFVA